MISGPCVIHQDTLAFFFFFFHCYRWKKKKKKKKNKKVMSTIVKWRETDELVTLPKPMFVCSIFIVLFKIKK